MKHKNLFIIFMMLVCIPVAYATLEDNMKANLVSYWTFNEGINNNTNDLIHGENGTLNNHTAVDKWVKSSTGTGYYFKRGYFMNSSWTHFPYASVSRSMSFLINVTGSSTGETYAKVARIGTTGTANWWGAGYGDTGIISLSCYAADTASGGSKFTYNTWNLFTYNYNATTTTKTLYVNGVLAVTEVEACTPDPGVEKAFGVETGITGMANVIDWMMILNRTMSVEEMLYVVNGGSYLEPSFGLVPPLITSINATSNPNGDTTDPFNVTGDLTPTFQLSTSGSPTTCGISNINGSYTAGTNIGANLWSVTLPFNSSLSCGSGQVVYFNCSNSAGEIINKSNVWACDAGAPSVGTVNGYCFQSLNVSSYNGTAENRKLQVECFNPNPTVDFSSVTITPPTGFGSASTIKVGKNISNSTSFTNLSQRGKYDYPLYTIAGSVITGNITMTTNTIQTYHRVDPDFAFIKDNQVDCSRNTTLDYWLDINDTLFFYNTGKFTVKDTMLTADKIKMNGSRQCKLFLDNGKIRILNTNIVHTYDVTPCFQESVNVSTTCGDYSTSSTGKYTLSGGSWTNAYKVTNADYSDYGTGGVTEAIIIINATKPTIYSNISYWQVKDYGGSANLTLNKICQSYYSEHILLSVGSTTNPTTTVSWRCHNGSEWLNLRQDTSGNRAYEEGIGWNIVTQLT